VYVVGVSAILQEVHVPVCRRVCVYVYGGGGGGEGGTVIV